MFSKLKQKKEMDKAKNEQEENVKKLRGFIKENFWPFLKETSKNVADAQMFCQVISTSLKDESNKEMRKKLVGDLGMLAQLDKKNEEYDRFFKAFQMFEGQSVSNALMVIEGMAQAINAYVQKEQKERKLTEFKDFEKDFE